MVRKIKLFLLDPSQNPSQTYWRVRPFAFNATPQKPRAHREENQEQRESGELSFSTKRYGFVVPDVAPGLSRPGAREDALLIFPSEFSGGVYPPVGTRLTFVRQEDHANDSSGSVARSVRVEGAPADANVAIGADLPAELQRALVDILKNNRGAELSRVKSMWETTAGRKLDVQQYGFNTMRRVVESVGGWVHLEGHGARAYF